MKRIVLSAIALTMAATLPALAQSPRSEAREYRQDGRIYHALRRGEITPREYRNLTRQQSRIDRAQYRASRDGVVTREERRRIERKQDRASRNIYRKAHNQRDMWWN